MTANEISANSGRKGLAAKPTVVNNHQAVSPWTSFRNHYDTIFDAGYWAPKGNGNVVVQQPTTPAQVQPKQAPVTVVEPTPVAEPRQARGGLASRRVSTERSMPIAVSMPTPKMDVSKLSPEEQAQLHDIYGTGIQATQQPQQQVVVAQPVPAVDMPQQGGQPQGMWDRFKGWWGEQQANNAAIAQQEALAEAERAKNYNNAERANVMMGLAANGSVRSNIQ